MIVPGKITTVLFDLDGTLVNTAPDLVNALNSVLRNHNHAPASLTNVAPYISTGAVGMLKSVLGEIPDRDKQQLVSELVEHYHLHIADNSLLYPDMDKVLEHLDQNNLSWGVVTNKITKLTKSLLDKLNLSPRAACIICGDTTSYSKPHPAPLLEACRITQSDPECCVYIGDASTDIQAAQRAMMPSLAAAYGFIPANEQIQNWGANAVVDNASQILDWINQHV